MTENNAKSGILASGTGRFVKALWLFGKSDVPVATLPTIAVALVVTGRPSPLRFFQGLLWIQVHLLAFQVKNQIIGIEEDRISKTHRPLASGLMSLETANRLYYCSFLLMWLLAFSANTVICTLSYAVAILVYNEGGLARSTLLKTPIGAWGLACYCWGTTQIFNDLKEVHGLKAVAVLMLGAIFATTGYAQDFRDRSADALMGRKTIPLCLPPAIARGSLSLMIIAWTVGLILLWKPPILAALVYGVMCIRTAAGFLIGQTERKDYASYIYYGFWLLGSSLLPIFARIRGELG